MQPYLFPYIGYFQLINSVDKFVMYDDVAYIKQGWINRNRILINSKAHFFTVPLRQVSSFSLINETEIDNKKYKRWKDKFFKTIELNYKKAPFFDQSYHILKSVFNLDMFSISELAIRSCNIIVNYLSLKTILVETSSIYDNNALKGQDRILDICKIEKAASYNNLPGGKELYSKEKFKQNDIDINFTKSNDIKYNQFNNEFVPWLSIIDVLMFNPKQKIQEYLQEYELI